MELNISFLKCQQCQGFGYVLKLNGEQVLCSVCKAEFSTIGFVQNDLIYWLEPLNTTAVWERKLKRYVDKTINFTLILFGVGGIISLIIELQLVSLMDDWLYIFIHKSTNLLIFWLSLLTDLLLYYRIEQNDHLAKPIKVDNKLRHYAINGDVADWAYWRTVPKHLKVNVAQHFNLTALLSVDNAFMVAKRQKHHAVQPIHLLLSLEELPQIKELFYRLEINHTRLQEIFNHVLQHCKNEIDKAKQLTAAVSFYEVLFYAYAEARAQNRLAVGVVELLMGCLQADKTLQEAFFEQKVDLNYVRNLVHWSNLKQDMLQHEQLRRHLASGKPNTVMNRAMTARPTRHLDAVSQDFTLMAKHNAFTPVVGRNKEIEAAFRVLQEGYGSVLLVGESGSGKSSLLQGIANLMTAENVPASLQDKRLVVTEPGAVIAGAGNIGALEERMQLIIRDIIQAGNIIWAIEDIHTLLGAGSTGSSIDLGKILMNYISQGYIKVIGTTTTPEFQKYIENQETFLRRFQIVRIPELATEAAIRVLEARSLYIESRYQVFFTYNAIEACVLLSERFIQDRHLPAKALDIMEEAAVYAKEHLDTAKQVTRRIVEVVMSEKTNVALTAVTHDEAKKLLSLEAELHKRVIGQVEAISAIGRALRRARQDIRDTSRPIASLLFLGPTGVGKTETAKAIAAVYFGNEHNMIRLDMSEYQTPDSISKLIGGTGSTGQLTEAVRRTPFSIVLLDELEKAHGDILNVFLQVLDDGRLSDGTGRTINFSNTMIIATSNAGTSFIQQQYQQQRTSLQIKEDIMRSDLLNKFFRPEFLNRFDHVAVFTPLAPDELQSIAELLLNKLAKQLSERGISLRWTTAAVVDLVKHGYDPVFGARPLRRYIQDTVEDAIAKLLLSEQLARRDVVELQANGAVSVIKAKPL
ncbi:MAG: ATP-dependent Clp protease ATP-binding subunit [Patescibacteria group bacterium]|jgi:ATP-dependent Clp protease ATP-binding subunit ClpC